MAEEMDASYLLYVEGVNILNVIEDTSQLSVRRGGSQYLRYAAEWVQAFFSHQAQSHLIRNWYEITLGASKGLFYFEADASALAQLQSLLNNLLSGSASIPDNTLYQKYGAGLKYFTFLKQILPVTHTLGALNLLPASHDSAVLPLAKIENEQFAALEQAIQVISASQQFRQPTIQLAGSQSCHSAICAWDNLRPANAKVEVNRGKTKQAEVSEATKARFDFGRSMKSQLLIDILNNDDCPPVIGDINSIGEGHYTDKQGSTLPLEGLGFTKDKVAVFYADGNQFGKIFSDCGSAEILRDITHQLAKQRQTFLNVLCQELANSIYGHSYVRTHDSKGQLVAALKLEVLLWGGDEITLVVPAWFGLRTVELFYQYAQQHDLILSDEKRPFSYASGLVFSQANTSVNRLEKVAKELAELVKDQKSRVAKGASVKQRVDAVSGCAYAVFESVDFPTQPVSDYLKKHHGLTKQTDEHSAALNQINQVLLSSRTFTQIEAGQSCFYQNNLELLNKIAQQTLAVRQLYRLVGAIHRIQKSDLPASQKDQDYESAQQPVKELLGDNLFAAIETLAQSTFLPLVESDSDSGAFSPEKTRPWVHLQELKDYLEAYVRVMSVNTKEGSE